jgi:hypothetical protein
MTADLTLPLVPEMALFALSVLVLVAGLMRHPARVVAVGEGKLFGWITLLGLLAVIGLTFTTTEDSSLFNGAFVQDGLALFAKRLVLAAAALERPRVVDKPTADIRAQGARVSLHAAVLAARHDGARISSRAGAAVRRIRADVDPALRPDGVPEARRRSA